MTTPTPTKPPLPRVSLINRNLFGQVFVTIHDSYSSMELVFDSTDEIRDVAEALFKQAREFDASGA